MERINNKMMRSKLKRTGKKIVMVKAWTTWKRIEHSLNMMNSCRFSCVILVYLVSCLAEVNFL
ncbi:unnamed protein product [Rhodiola kirilowii]